MGVIYIEVEIANISIPERTERVELLPDSGLILSIIPASVLKRLGIEPYAQHVALLPNGDSVSRPKGMAFFRLGDRVGGADVLFGEEGDAALIGSLALASLGLYLDPIRRELGDLPLLLTATQESVSGQTAFTQ